MCCHFTELLEKYERKHERNEPQKHEYRESILAWKTRRVEAIERGVGGCEDETEESVNGRSREEKEGKKDEGRWMVEIIGR